MANVNLTQRDIDYIARVVETEVPRSLANRNPAEYDRMVRGVVDTVTNRMASGVFPSTATGVLNQPRQFSKITGPSRLDPYGSVQNTPRASAATKNLVTDYIAGRAAGEPTTIGGALNYANPNFSSKSNLTSWINPMIERGATMLGVGRNVHAHGTAPNLQPVGEYSLAAEGMPGAYVPRPTSLDDLPQAAQAGGILSAINAPVPGLVQREELAPQTAGLMMNAYQPIAQPTEAQASLDTLRQGQSQTQPGLLAGQYAAYGAGKVAPQQAGLLSEDVAYQRMINDLNAQRQQLQAGADPMASIPNWTQQPQAQVQAPEVTQVQAPEMAAQPIAQQPAQQFTGGLLSPQEQEQFAAQRAMLSRQPTNRQRGIGGKKMAGAIGGGLLGGLMLGPLGGLLGAALGQSAVGGRLNTMMTGYPTAPSRAGSVGNTGRISRSQLNESGRNAYNTSEQFREAVDQGRVGLY